MQIKLRSQFAAVAVVGEHGADSRGGLGAAGWAPAISLAGLLAFAGAAVLAAWIAEGRQTLPWQSLIQIPIYALRKVTIYAGLVLSRQTAWTRTRRDGEGS